MNENTFTNIIEPFRFRLLKSKILAYKAGNEGSVSAAVAYCENQLNCVVLISFNIQEKNLLN
jgi:hypothetical protein